MSVAGDIIDDLKFKNSDKVRALTGSFGFVAIGVFITIGYFGGASQAAAESIHASGVSAHKTAAVMTGGTH